jgi:DNA mismatch repair ATPase MutS
MGREVSATYLERILTCAETLGVERPKIKKSEARRLSPDILQAAFTLRPETAARLKSFYEAYRDLYQDSVTYYPVELQFYLVMLDLFDRIREANIPLTFPTVREGRGLSVTEAYDISLFAKNEANIIPNDITFSNAEPFFFLTGANGGGKTTYLRTVGIAATLFACGCPIPCREAEMGELSAIFTHFPRDERFDGSGRFVEENRRVQKILESMDDRSLVLLNETYSTTNEENAVLMTEKLARELHEKAILGLYITHQHGLTDLGIPYLNVLIDRSDANRRTYKIARQKSTGGSYAKDILTRLGLTEEALTERFGALSDREEANA